MIQLYRSVPLLAFVYGISTAAMAASLPTAELWGGTYRLAAAEEGTCPAAIEAQVVTAADSSYVTLSGLCEFDQVGAGEVHAADPVNNIGDLFNPSVLQTTLNQNPDGSEGLVEQIGNRGLFGTTWHQTTQATVTTGGQLSVSNESDNGNPAYRCIYRKE